MAQHQISADQITPGVIIRLKGKLGYSQLNKLIDGVALAKRISTSKSKHPTKKPHTTATLHDVQILNPGQHPLEEFYLTERFFVSNSEGFVGTQSYSIDDVGGSIPPVFSMAPDGQLVPTPLTGSLAQGLEVVLEINSYASKDQANRGWGINNVYILEPVRYYRTGGVDVAALAALGLVVAPENASYRPELPVAEAEPAIPAGSVTGSTGLPLPAFNPNPVPQAAPVAAPPVFAAPVAAPVAAPPVFQAPVAAPVAAPAAPVVPTQVATDQSALLAQFTPEQIQAFIAASQGQAPAAPAATPADPWAPAPGAGVSFTG